MDAELKGSYTPRHKGRPPLEIVHHPMYAEFDEDSPSIANKDDLENSMPKASSASTRRPMVPLEIIPPSPSRLRSVSSPEPPSRDRSNSIFSPSRPRANTALSPREIPNPLFSPRGRSNSVFSPPRERSNSIFGGKAEKKIARRRDELEQFLQNRGFSPEELDSIVAQFQQIHDKLEGGEWVTREEFKKFLDVREQAFCDHLFDVFKQKHKMHNFPNLDFCPSPQVSRERPVGDDGVEMDAINLREFLCGMLLLQSSDIDKKLRMVFDLYNSNGSEITRSNLGDMLLISAKENNIRLTGENLNTILDHIFKKMDTTDTGTISFEAFKSAFQEFPMEIEQRNQDSPLGEFLNLNKSSPASPTSTAPFSWTMNIADLEGSTSDDIGTSHPDFVERVYEGCSRALLLIAAPKIISIAPQGANKKLCQNNYDPQRTQRKQKKFENIEKGNYFPQQESMYKRANVNRRLRTKIYSSGSKYVFLLLFSLANIGLFTWQFVVYALNEPVISRLGWGIPFARATAIVLKFDTVLLLIPVSRNFLTYLRAAPVINRMLPLDKNISFHKLAAIIVVLASVGHWVAHLFNFYYISTASLGTLQQVNPVYFTFVPTYIQLNFATVPGLTGYIMLIALLVIIIFAAKKVRRHAFEKFYYSHHCFIIFYAALLVHGMKHILGPYEYWKWFIGPAAIYLIERSVRVYKQRMNLSVIEAKILPDQALMLKMEMPKRHFSYKPGQYIFLNFPEVSKFEWHPFTLTSAPFEDFLSVHIRSAGNWTKKVYRLCEICKDRPNFNVHVDGPYGSASEHVFSYKRVVMIGAGIGVTPFASVLKQIKYRLDHDRASMKLEKVHFFWTCRDQGAFKWFADTLSQLQAHSGAKDFLEVNTFLTGAVAQHDIRSILLWYGLEQEYSQNNVDLVTGLSSRTYWGRPNFDRIMDYIFQQYPNEKVGVFFCGPNEMGHTIKSSCRTRAAVHGSTFYFHKEIF